MEGPLHGDSGHKIQLLLPGEQNALGSQGEFSEPLLPVGKPGTSLGENRDHSLGVLPRAVGWQKTLNTAGDSYPEKNHGRFIMILSGIPSFQTVSWAVMSPRPALYRHLSWRKAMANELGFPSEVGSAHVPLREARASPSLRSSWLGWLPHDRRLLKAKSLNSNMIPMRPPWKSACSCWGRP